MARAEANLDVIMAGLAVAYPDSNEDRQASLTLTDDMRLPPQAAGPVYVGAAGLMLVVGLVLLVACANVMGMLLARASARRREIGVRLAIGAGRGRLVRQLLTESLLLSSFGAMAGLVLAWSLLRVLAAAESPVDPLPITFEFVLDARAFTFTAALAAGAGVLAGLVPALGVTRPNLVRDLNGAVAVARVGRRRWSLRDALVAAQLAVTVPLLVLAGLLARGAIGASDGVSLGFDPDRVAAVGTDLDVIGYERESADRFLRAALERVQSMPGVETATLASRAPLDVSFSPQNVLVPGVHGPADRGAPVDTAGVSADYFDTLGVPCCKAGPSIPPTRRNLGAWPSSAKPWPFASGRRGRRSGGGFGWPTGTGSRSRSSACPPTTRCGFRPRSPQPTCTSPRRSACARARCCSPGRRVTRRRCPPTSAASSAGWSRTSSFFLQGDTLRETAAVTMLPFRAAAAVASASGMVALVLGAIGLYGVVAYLIARRTREFAIRAALGARSGALLRLVLATGGWMVTLGVGIGAVLAFAVSHVVAPAAGGIPPADPVVWTGALLLVLGVAAAAHVGPASRVVRLDLTRALHAE